MRIGIVLIMVMMLCVAGCGQKEASVIGESDMTALKSGEMGAPEDVVKGRELICLADSREEAEQIAKDYGIELVDFAHGVASFHTDENLQDVITRGKEKGLKELSINTFNKTF